MDTQDELERLRERALSLDRAIKDLDFNIERAMHSIASGSTDTGRAISIVRDRHNDQLGLMYDLGKVEAQITDLENRFVEQGERGQEIDDIADWQGEVPLPVQEDHLDWLRPVLDAPAPIEDPALDERHSRHGAEESMLREEQRDDAGKEDYLDWRNS